MDIRPETTSPGNYKKAENIKSLMKGNAIRNPEEYFMEEQKQYSTL